MHLNPGTLYGVSARERERTTSLLAAAPPSRLYLHSGVGFATLHAYIRERASTYTHVHEPRRTIICIPGVNTTGRRGRRRRAFSRRRRVFATRSGRSRNSAISLREVCVHLRTGTFSRLTVRSTRPHEKCFRVYTAEARLLRCNLVDREQSTLRKEFLVSA